MSAAKVRVKAMLRYSHRAPATQGTFFSQSRVIGSDGDKFPHYVLPAAPESYDAMVEQMAKVICARNCCISLREVNEECNVVEKMIIVKLNFVACYNLILGTENTKQLMHQLIHFS